MAIRYTLHTHTHTHTRLTVLFPGLPEWAGTRKVKPIWILVKQETVSGSGISWAIYKSASHCRQITMPVPHQSCFLQAGCPSCRPTNSVKALKAIGIHCNGMLFALCCFGTVQLCGQVSGVHALHVHANRVTKTKLQRVSLKTTTHLSMWCLHHSKLTFQ